MADFKFTIFTPCYNGANTIKRVFDSVESQTYTNFEWIIINDGSMDNSDEVIRGLMEKSPVRSKITYLVQPNLGKHRAWNRAVDMATGELFLSADADDSFLPNTLDYFNREMLKLANGGSLQSCKYSGVNVCVYDPETMNMVGSPYPYDGLVSDNIELAYKYNIRGEHWGIVRTDLLRKNKFPDGKGHFWSEGRIWFSFALQGYKVVCFNECLRARYYEPDSLVHNKGYVYDKDTNLMYMQNYLWTIKACGGRIFRYSPKGYFILWKNVLAKFVRMSLGCLKNK